jgi:hypothetical protein
MAVVEIAKIQVRRGQENQTGVPRLAGGEFAWAADTEKLYIGLKVEDGGSRDDNVRILTENDLQNFFRYGANTTAYIYKEGTNITAPDGITEEVERSLQDKLDDIINVADFGAVGDGVNDDSAAIQRAIDRIFLGTLVDDGAGNFRSVPTSSKILYFPAGTFRIQETLFIPRFTTLIGQGIDVTIINLASTDKHAFQTCDAASVGGTEGYITFDDTMTVNSIGRPKNIRIEGMTIKFDSQSTEVALGKSLLSLDCAPNSIIRDVKFVGNHVKNDEATKNYSGIDIRGFFEVSTQDIVIDRCEFVQLYNGVMSNYDIQRILIENSSFIDLRKGVAFNDAKDPAATQGPTAALIKWNRFDRIEEEAVYFGASEFLTFNSTQNNRYVEVGNGNTAYAAGTPVLSFVSCGNSSTNDFFERYYTQAADVSGITVYNPLVLGNAVVDMLDIKLYSGVPPLTAIKLPITGYPHKIELSYIAPNTSNRIGILNVDVSGGAEPGIILTDTFSLLESEDQSPLFGWRSVVNNQYKYFDIQVFYTDEDITPVNLGLQAKIIY